MGPPKGSSSKSEIGRAKKAQNEAAKLAKENADKARKEEEQWEVGARGVSAQQEKEKKRRQALEKKAAAAALLQQEEAELAKPKKTPSKKSSNRPASPSEKQETEGVEEVESFAATGIDDALDLLNALTAKMDNASLGQQAAALEKHPERRIKAIFNAYVERELPQLKIERPGLRLQQYKELLFKRFQKSPENPFNQTAISYDATKEEKLEALEAKRTEVVERLREP